ncbi:MAG TPA: SMP-30/gluconolactonase/LRE family protein [Usitatibacter sp.]|nr:SMP-30/gluconolactonase/LRE family protein [Usitatibacter sp.]
MLYNLDRMRPFLVLAVLAFSLPAFAQQPDVEGAKRTIAAIEDLLAQRPNDANLYFYLSRFKAEVGDKPGAVAAMEKVAELGEGYLPTKEFGFAAIWDYPPFQAVRAKLEAKLPRLDYAPTALRLEDRTIIPEGIAFDSHSGRFYLGSIAQRRVLELEPDGTMRELPTLGAKLDEILGLAFDGPRRVLYAVSTSALTTKGEKNRRNAVVSFDVDARRLLKRYEVPGARQLNDVTAAPGGRVFASDSGSGAVYEINIKGPGPDARELVPAGRIRGTNGLAASADGKRLHVAHSTGLAVVDIATGDVKRVENRTRENIGAIDGLYQWQGQLIGVQNVTNPGRVILITLTPDGSAVTSVKTMLSHHHNALDEPTTGAVGRDSFYLLAATAVTRYNREGVIERPETLPQPTVLRIPLPR